GIILVFSQIIPRCAFDFFPVHSKQLGPRISSFYTPIARHHCRYSSKGDAVAAIGGRHKLTFSIHADVRQAVRATNNLSRPAMINTRVRNDLFQASEQANKRLVGISFLACLVIFPAEHDVIEATAFIDSQVIVRLSRIPKEGFWNCPGWDSGTENVTSIKRQFCLEQRRARNASQADKGIVRCHHNAIEADPVAVNLYAALLRIEFIGCTFSKTCKPLPEIFATKNRRYFGG